MYVNHLSKVIQALDKAAENRAERRAILPNFNTREFAEELRILRKKIQASRDMRFSDRGCAWKTLSPMELGLLERQLEYYQDQHRLMLSSVAQDKLDIMRINVVLGYPEVTGDMFREAAHELFKETTKQVVIDFMATYHVALVLPLRAALACVTAYHEKMRITNIGLIGIGRNELTAEPDMLYYERPPKIDHALIDAYLVVDPMLATGGSLEKTLLWLQDMGVPLKKVYVQCVIAAPEGLDYILNKYPVRIFTSAIDGGLNEKAYIKDVGIGDFGDHYMRDLTVDGMNELWVNPGILTPAEITIIAQRTASIIAK